MTLSFEPLTPTAFLARSAAVFGDRLAVLDEDRRFTYADLGRRSRRLAGALAALGAAPGDRVAVLAPNTSALLEAHHGVPLAGAVLVALNVRLSPAELAYVVGHSEARVLLADHRLLETAREVVRRLDTPVRLVVVGGPRDEYEALLDGADELARPVPDERGPLSINYTSGTTGAPKGVVYHHRGATLQALAMAFHTRLEASSVFLWTLPMFHCNGWSFPWAVTAAGATHLCLPKVDPAAIWRHIARGGVTHFNAAPTVLLDLAHHPDAAPAPAGSAWPRAARRRRRRCSRASPAWASRSRTSTG